MAERQIISRLVKTEYWELINKIIDRKVTNILNSALDSNESVEYLRGKRDALKELIGWIESREIKDD